MARVPIKIPDNPNDLRAGAIFLDTELNQLVYVSDGQIIPISSDGQIIPTDFTLKITNPVEILEYKPTGWTQPISYVSIINAEKLPNAIDKYYMYGGSHDDYGIYLFTAPDIKGPWTPYGLINLTSQFVDHLTSPEAIIIEEKDAAGNVKPVVCLYYHGELNGHQPTAVAVSYDGINFTEVKCPIIPVASSSIKFYSHGLHYMRIFKDGNKLYGVFQSNNPYATEITSYGHAVTALAYSYDGIEWTLYDKPILANVPDIIPRGPHTPALLRINNRFVLIFGNHPIAGDGNIWYAVSDELEPFSFEVYGILINKEDFPYFYRVEAPQIFIENGKIYIIFRNEEGSVGAEFQNAKIYLAELSVVPCNLQIKLKGGVA